MIGLAAVLATLAVGLPGQSAPSCGKLFGAFPPIVSVPCLRPYLGASIFNRRLPARLRCSRKVLAPVLFRAM